MTELPAGRLAADPCGLLMKGRSARDLPSSHIRHSDARPSTVELGSVMALGLITCPPHAPPADVAAPITGSLSGRLIREAGCPLLLVPPMARSRASGRGSSKGGVEVGAAAKQ